MTLLDELRKKIIYIFHDLDSDGLIFDDEGEIYLRMIKGSSVSEKYFLQPGKYRYLPESFTLIDIENKRIITSFEDGRAVYSPLNIPGVIRGVVGGKYIYSLLFNVVQIHYFNELKCSLSPFDSIHRILPREGRSELAISGTNSVCVLSIEEGCKIFCRTSKEELNLISFGETLVVEEGGFRREYYL